MNKDDEPGGSGSAAERAARALEQAREALSDADRAFARQTSTVIVVIEDAADNRDLQAP